MVSPLLSVSATPPPQPISNLAVGDIVRIKDGGVGSNEYIIVHKGNPDASLYDESCDGVWVLRKECYMISSWSQNLDHLANSTNIKDIIKQVKIPYTTYNITTGISVRSGVNGYSCKGFALCGYEARFTQEDQQSLKASGALLDYFKTGSRVATYSGSAVQWSLRDVAGGDQYMWVFANGSGVSIAPDNTSGGIRPAFILPSDTLVSADGTIQV